MSISELISSINAAADSPTELNEEERSALLVACDGLKSKLENPREKIVRIMFAPLQATALRLAVDMKLFGAAATLSASGKEVKLEDLASQTGADPLLVTRIMRFLTGMGIFNESGQGKFTPTPLSGLYVTASPLAQGILHMSSQNEVICSLPAYFAENGYQNPGDAYNGPFQYARHTKLHCFDWLATQPRLQHALNVVMGITRTVHGQRWFEFFPASTKLSVKSPSDTLLVDIGGGVGHDLITFKEHFPTLPGKLVVQDIPVVVDSITDLPSGIEAMKHDFFTTQPIKGANAYFLSNVLHDWPDKQALQILGNIKEAMGTYSILLISENVLPESNVPLMSASTDLMMMAGFSSLERTENQFSILLQEAGLQLVKVWLPEGADEGEGRRVLEAVLKA